MATVTKTEATKYSVGQDGRLYFSYNLNEVFCFFPIVGEPFDLTIIGCIFENGKEYYQLSGQSNALASRYSKKELEEMFRALDHDIVEEGTPTELPLLEEEVRTYYAAKLTRLHAANAEANKKLKDTDYNKLRNKRYSLQRNLRMAIADDEADEVLSGLKEEIAKIAAKEDKIIDEQGIDKRILTKVKECPLCDDTGIMDGGEICECALKRVEAIKKYNAMLRLESDRADGD